ncbi:TPA: hypothetical protein QCQ26_005130 [Bacillus cereus]|nr:hypothetical protein [Bacillus cereus]
MREIKYKAYVRELNLVLPVLSIQFDFKKVEVPATYSNHIDTEYFNFEQVELIQYTGLKNSKGNEIYEGDIVRVWEQDSYTPNRDSGGGIIDYDCEEGFSQLGVVSFQGAWYTYETKKHLAGRKEQIYAPLDFTDDLFVVGNIYENPELLQGSDEE